MLGALCPAHRVTRRLEQALALVLGIIIPAFKF